MYLPPTAAQGIAPLGFFNGRLGLPEARWSGMLRRLEGGLARSFEVAEKEGRLDVADFFADGFDEFGEGVFGGV